ncbi:Fc fragment of IgE, low affinity II, receptor for (CD23) [Chamberlinius hualienensis]
MPINKLLLVLFGVLSIFNLGTSLRNVKTSDKQCPCDFELIGNHCYNFSQVPASWFKARDYCGDLFAKLAYPVNKIENELLQLHLNTTYKGWKFWWIGGNDIYKEGFWTWTHTRDTITDRFWAASEPNDGDQSEDCLRLVETWGFQWSDSNCLRKFYFICQKKSFNNN